MTLMLIEVKHIKEFTQQMSEPVEKAVDQVVQRIMAMIDAPGFSAIDCLSSAV